MMRRLFMICLSFLTCFQVIHAQDLESALTIEVVGDGIVEINDGQNQTKLEKGDVYNQSYELNQSIQVYAKANDGNKLSLVSVDGDTPNDFVPAKEWTGNLITSKASTKVVFTFSKEIETTGGTVQDEVTSKARSMGLKVNGANDVLWQNPYLPGIGINAAYYSLSNGKMAFCGEGMKAAVARGQTVGDPEEQNNANLRKALFYGYKGPQDLLTSRYGETGAIALTSELVSYANCGTCSASALPASYNWIMANVANLIFSQADPVDVYKVYRCSNSLYGTSWQNIYTKRQDICYGEYNPYGKVKIKKASSNDEISKDNVNYASMEGSQYGLYSDAAAHNLVGTLTLNANGESNTLEQVKAGHYYLKELKQPQGFALDVTVYDLDVVANELTTKSVGDQPQSNPIEIVLNKVDKDTKTNQIQGEASLEDAQFTIRYFDQKDGQVKRTWVVKTDAQGIAKLNDAYKVSGDDWYTNSQGQVVLPLGYVTIQESKAPKGYQLNKEVFTREITSSGNSEKVETYQIPTIENKVKTGKFALAKFISDADNSEVLEAEVGSQFVAVLEFYYKQANQDIQAALKLVQKQGTEKEWSILNTDKNGEAQSSALAYGTYIVKQVKVGSNAQETEPLNETFKFVVSDKESYGQLNDGRRIDASTDGLVHYHINDIPFTSMVKIVKKDADSGKTISLNGATFQVKKVDQDGNVVKNYSKKTIRTDENGIVSMKVGQQWIDTFVTNAENRLNISSAYSSSDEKGSVSLPLSLPSGNYQLMETQAPKGYLLSDKISFKITKSNITGTDEDGQAILTIVAKDPSPKASLTFKKTWEEGTKGHGKAKFRLTALEDIVDPADGKVVYQKDEVVGTYELDENDTIQINDLPMGTGRSSFLWEEISTYENYQLNTKKSTVSFVQNDEKTKDYHQDLSMENSLIQIKTKALNKLTNEKEFNSAKEIKVSDVVSYQGLHKKESYVLYAQLVDVETETVVAEGKKEFKAEKEDGSIEVPIQVDASNLGGKNYVVYETLYGTQEHKDCEIASHRDLSDKNQTITIKDSKISTQAHASNESNYQQVKQGKVTLTDTVSYEGLVTGQDYVLKGVLMDAGTNEVYKEIQSSKTFSPKESKGKVEMDFEVDTDEIKAGKKIVVFETLYEIQDEKEIEVCEHKDITDQNQSISFIDIHTKASISNETDMQQKSNEKVQWTDCVSYEGLEIGQEYTIKTSLMQKDSGKEVQKAERTFLVEETNGTVEIQLETEASECTDFVFFESLEKDGKEIAQHKDMEDQNQTIHVVDLHTKAQSEKGNQSVLSSSKVTFKDVVSYENLVIGKEYTITGKLMNKETKEALLIDGKKVTSTTTFKPEQKDGQVTLEYTLNSSDLEGKEVVVFEDLYKDEIQVASHADIEDQNQTVKFKPFEIKINKTDSISKTNITKQDFAFTLYSNETCTQKVETVHANQEDGTATFKIKEGVYFLKESQAPKGYRLSNDVIKVEVKENQLYVKDQKVETDTNYVYTFNMENTKNPTSTSKGSNVKTGFTTYKAFFVLVFYGALFGIFEILKHK